MAVTEAASEDPNSARVVAVSQEPREHVHEAEGDVVRVLMARDSWHGGDEAQVVQEEE